MQIRAVMEVDGTTRVGRIDPEEFHDPEQEVVQEWHIRKLMEGGATKKGISEALAWDDLTHMQLEAGKVVEARARKWATYVISVCMTKCHGPGPSATDGK